MKLARRFCATAFLVLFLSALCALAGEARTEIDLSGAGWRLWLDRQATWENDPLFPPPVDIRKLPTNPPTGGWQALQSGAISVSTPGTVEEYLHPGNGPEGDIKGVSWWMRGVTIPKAHSPRRLLLRFDAVRLRAEVFVNRRLVGYDIVGNSPFEVDITDDARLGQTIELAVRVTDPGGNFDWRDSSPFQWGTHVIPMSHGFGGITGRVRLLICDPVYVDDVYVQNTPAITDVNVLAAIKNTTGKLIKRNARINVKSKANDATPVVFVSERKRLTLAPGDNTVSFKVSAPDAKPWDLEHPNLYVCEIVIENGGDVADRAQRTFGFRWFAPEGIGGNALFRLNGRRVVLRTAISWGFWPVNGIFPTPAWVAREIESAKSLGQNMLNFHRCIGHPEILDKADERGLLFYEEPGAYVSGDRSPFAQALAREKLLRMVKRDRSHPSLVIYNMINEAWDSGGAAQDKAVLDGHVRDMRDAHALDPSRVITHTSAWATKPDVDEPPKMHMRAFDDTVHMRGWFDIHHAGGPEVWRQSLYGSPDAYYNRTDNRKEIVFWGEEGAISTPPRLDLIKRELEAAPRHGWDGSVYLDWHRRFDDFLTRKSLRGAFPTVDALTKALGAVSHYHQGRKIETMRINDAADGYAVNGWEAEIVENHSGIVDCFRNPKADPAIMAYYNQPLYIAVKTRSQFAQIPDAVAVDFYAVNEVGVKGAHTLEVTAHDPAGQPVFKGEFPVSVTGGDVFGELLQANVLVPIAGATGIFRIEAELRDATGKLMASGLDEVLALDWKSQALDSRGATWEAAPRIREFLAKEKGLRIEAYRDDLGPLEWIAVTRPPAEGALVDILAESFRLTLGGGAGLTATFFDDRGFKNEIYRREYGTLDYFVPDGAAPDQQSSVLENYGVRWEGWIVPQASGLHTFAVESSDGVRLWVEDKPLFDDLNARSNTVNRGRTTLEAGQPVPIRLELWHGRGDARCKMLWAPPEANLPDVAKLMNRVKNDGATLLILDRADTWMDLVQKHAAVTYRGSFRIGTAWLGGLHFVREHPLFEGLPADTAMDWPYQAVVRGGKVRSGLLLEGEELVAGAWHSHPMALGTAVGIISCGKGRIIVSTLDIAGPLNSPDTSAHVARKLLCNFIAYGRKTP